MIFSVFLTRAPAPEMKAGQETIQEISVLEEVEIITFPKYEVKEISLQDQLGVLYQVAKCESELKQFNIDGTLLRGRQVSDDVGILQINEYFHLEESQRLGYDIHTLEGNIGYGKYLYSKQGLKPWSASAPCWDK